MILDAQNLFSASQSVLVSAASTNVINLGDDDALLQSIVEKGRIDVFVQVQTAFTVGTSLAVAVQTDSAEGFGTVVTLYTSAAIAAATLVIGYQFRIAAPIIGLDQYLRLYYTIDGTMTTGALDAGLVLDRQTNGI